MSLSSRRAWIEIKTDEIVNLVYSTGRSPHGERGLKSVYKLIAILSPCRSPHGERGLKYIKSSEVENLKLSLSSRRAWIEISKTK